MRPSTGARESTENDDATSTSGARAEPATSSSDAATVETARSCGPIQATPSAARHTGSLVRRCAAAVSAEISAIASAAVAGSASDARAATAAV